MHAISRQNTGIYHLLNNTECSEFHTLPRVDVTTLGNNFLIIETQIYWYNHLKSTVYNTLNNSQFEYHFVYWLFISSVGCEIAVVAAKGATENS